MEKKEDINQKERTDGRRWARKREKEKRRVEREKILSKIYGIRTLGFRRSKRKIRSTHRELRVGTKILEFCQTPQGREFSYLSYF